MVKTKKLQRGTQKVLSASSVTLLGLLASLFVSLRLPSVCLAQKATQKNSEQEQTFFAHVAANPSSLLPLTSTDGVAGEVAGLFFESLLDRHWDTYEWMPMIAKSWQISPDGKEFTFVLNEKAKFHDGSKVTVEDVKFSYDVIFMKGVDTAPLKPYYESIQKIEILGPEKVKFVVKDSYYKNFDVCAGLTIYQKKHYTNLYQKDNTLAKSQSVKTPMGTSEWKLQKWDDNQQIILTRDENYWNKETQIKYGTWNTNRKVFKIIQDPAVEFETFRKGDLTYTSLSPKQWSLQTNGPEFQSKIKKVQTKNKTAVGYGYVAWNQKNPLFANKDVRWAMSHLMDLKKWSEKLDFGLTEPTISAYSPKMDEHDPSLKAVPFDIKQARKKLASAGWIKAGKDGVLEKDGKRFEFTLMYPVQSKESLEPYLVDYKNQAAKVGVLMNLKAVEWTSFTKLLDDKNFEALSLFWTRQIDGDLKQIWHSASMANNGSNFISLNNPELDKLIDEHRFTLERNKRLEIARKMQKLIYDEQPYSFMLERKYTLYAHQNYVQKEKDSYNYTIGNAFWKLNQP
jgi:ABC-type transport system substrate-binding protein